MDIKFDEQNFDYKSSYNLNKDRLGGSESDHVMTIKKISTSDSQTDKLRILIYSPTNKIIPTGDGKLFSADFKTRKNNWGNHTFELMSVIASKEDNTNLTLDLVNGTINILAAFFNYNGNSQTGEPDVTDFTKIYKDENFSQTWQNLKNSGNDKLIISLNKSELTNFTLTKDGNPISWPIEVAPNSEYIINVAVNTSKIASFEESLFLESNHSYDDNRKGVKEFKFKAEIYNENKVIVQSNADAENNKTSKVKVSINGDENITSFQFDIIPDQRIKMVAGSAKLLKSSTDHVISSSVQTDSNNNEFLRVVSYSPTNALLSQPIGDIVEFDVRPEGIVEPGSYNLNISGVVLTNAALTNVSSSYENGSINLKTGKLGFPSPFENDEGVETLYLGELFRNSFNDKDFTVSNAGNKKIIISAVTTDDTDFTFKTSFPIEIDPGGSKKIEFNIIPSKQTPTFASIVKISHDGGSKENSVKITGALKNRNILVPKNINAKRAEVNTIPISLLNSNEIKGMQFDVTLPKESKSFNWTLTADSNDDFSVTELSNAKDPGLTHYVGDEINFINNSGGSHPLFIVTGFDDNGAYDASKQLAGVTNQGATTGTVKVDLSEVAPGTYYYYVCGTHKSMKGEIKVLPKFAIDAKTDNLVADRTNNFVLTQAAVGARKYRVLIYSNNNSKITGNRGDLLNLPLVIYNIPNQSMDIVDGSYNLEIDNIVISGNDNRNIASEETSTGTFVIGGASEFDPVIDPNQEAYVRENPEVNTYFYKVKASDADANNFLDDYKITSGNDDGTFGIVSETGDLYVIKPQNIDYETKTVFNIGVTVSDGFETSAEETIKINVTDIPNQFVLDNLTVNVYKDYNLGGVIDLDDDNDIRTSSAGNEVIYEIHSGNDKDQFSIDSSGKITFVTPPSYSDPKDSDKDNLYELTVKTTVVNDVSDDKPTVTSEKTVSIKEGTSDALTMTSIVTGPASDIDGDGIIDSLDNCPNVSNANQRDFDSNGEGDACEDSDGDGILDKQDICPLIPNPGQEDLNFNGIGDACEDSDGDGIIDLYDNCPKVPNADQSDMDGDGIGDVCDNDKDGDGIDNDKDNCPDVANADQKDSDGNGVGDACENSTPLANAQSVTTVEDIPLEITLTGSDADGDTLTYSIVDNPTSGTVSLDGSKATYTPNAGYFGSDSFTFKVNDGSLDSEKATISITVTSNDLDGDGVLNDDDECPNTPSGTVVDTKGCPFFTLPVDNNKVEITSATCIDNNDGSIGLSIEDASHDYTVTITGQSDVKISGDDKTATVTGLAKGSYTVCFKVDGQSAYEQCFEVLIEEPKALTAFIDVDEDNRTSSIQLGGSNLYNVEVNGKLHRVEGDNFTTALPTGLSIIKVSTDLDCQVMIEREIFISEDVHYYPNPTRSDVNVHIGGEDRNVMVSVFSEKGDLIYRKEQQVEDMSRLTEIDLSLQITGTYLVVMESKTVRKTFKIIKR